MPLKNLEKQSRIEIAKALPDAFKRAMTSYRHFIAKEQTDNSENFKKHHDACKVAISHIELLIKLAKWVDEQTEGVDHSIMAQLIQSAQEVANYEGKANG